ncbi:MAG: zinc ribbon domain-containing protein [Nocardioides sp.]|uniref:zinc-ribbon domain-containing protein n=1 Tax=Nocardioides sp. TaxID=35761 RepID=UPI0039E4EE27
MAVEDRTAQTNARIRTSARIGGAVLTVFGGIVFVTACTKVFGGGFDGPGPGWMAAWIGSLVVFGIGLQLLNIGFLRTQANYLAGEAGGAVRSVAGDVAGGIRDASAAGSDGRTGPFCSACGVRNDVGARFCDACGTALVTAG